MWSIQDVSFEILDDMTDHPVVTLLVTTPAGRLMFAAEPVALGRVLLLRGTHVQGAEAGGIGAANLMVLAQALMEGMDYHGLDVEGAVRTTGANPGRRTRLLRFARRVRASPGNGGTQDD